MSAKNVRQSAVKANEKLRQTFEVKPQKQKSTRLQNPSDDEQQLHETEQAVATNQKETTEDNFSDTSLDSDIFYPLPRHRNESTGVNQFFPSNCEVTPPLPRERTIPSETDSVFTSSPQKLSDIAEEGSQTQSNQVEGTNVTETNSSREETPEISLNQETTTFGMDNEG